MKVRVTNIQRFCLHDGPGIRTTVFLKGCSLRCPWCSNPESINYEIEKYQDPETGIIGKFGYDISLDQLKEEVLKDQAYYKIGHGGVTFTGGEALLQFNKLEPLLEDLKKEKVNLCVETSLYVSSELLNIAIKNIDEFIIDIKILDKVVAKEILGGNIDLYYNNIKELFTKIKRDKITFRIPVTKEYVLTEKHIENLIGFLKKYKPGKIELFKLHQLGKKKYMALNKKFNEFKTVSDEEMNNLKKRITKLNIETEIISL